MIRLPTASTLVLFLGLGSSTAVLPSPAAAQLATRTADVRQEHVFTLVPQAACVRLSTMQIGSNAQVGMRSGARNHNSSRSNRTSGVRLADGVGSVGTGAVLRAQNHNSSRSNRGAVPMARPALASGDDDDDGFPDLWANARIHVSEAAARGRGAEVHLRFGRGADAVLSDLIQATTFGVDPVSAEQRGNPLHEESGSTGQSALYETERGIASETEPLRTWTWALVPRAGDPDSDEDGYGDALDGAVLRVSRLGGRFHVALELAGAEDQRAAVELLGTQSFTISADQGR